jgi:hypothetical protein
MATEKQIAANRRNAQLSTGPRTEEGKSRSRMNAWRHGLTGMIDVRTPEEQESHDKFCAAIVASLDAQEGIERQLAHSVAEDHWRLNRARTIENNIFTLAASFEQSDADSTQPEIDDALADARTFVADPERFQLLTIYERRIQSNMQRNLKLLTELQNTRRTLEAKRKEESRRQREQAFEEARLLTQLAQMEGVSCDLSTDYPDPNGFVFSPEEIAHSIRRSTRLAAAREAESAAWSRPVRRAA